MPDHALTSSTSKATIQPRTCPTPRPVPVELVFDYPSDETLLVRTLCGPNPPTALKVQFNPSITSDKLIGMPAAWCNTPTVGQPLIYMVPVTFNGTTTGVLEVKDAAGTASAVRIRIKLQHSMP